MLPKDNINPEMGVMVTWLF